MAKAVCLVVLLACLAMPGRAQVKVDLVGDSFTVSWDGTAVVLPSLPALRRLGGGSRVRFDPASRQYRAVQVPPVQDVYLTVYNSKRQQVCLGEPHLTVSRQGGGVVYREDYPTAATSWQVAIVPVEPNGLDLNVEVETSPEFWLADFDLSLFGLNFAKAALDCGAISDWARKNRTWDDPGPYTRDGISISYPNGPGCFVPAGVMQDAKLALGVCLLGAHQSVVRDYYCSLNLNPAPDGKSYTVSLRSSDNPFYGNVYHQKVVKHYRFRMSDPVPVGPRGYFSLLDAKDLWRDYMVELEKYVPVQPTPAYDKSKNNIIIENFFMSEGWLVSPENPNGYLMEDPRWKSNPWEWREKITPEMSPDEVQRITGFTDENLGRPVKWIRAFAEKNVREMREANAQALITWASAQAAEMYIPESHLFPPELEELMPVEGPCRNWDWVQGNLVVRNPRGERILEKRNVLIHAFNPENLIQLEQRAFGRDAFQRLSFTQADLTTAGAPYAAAAAQLSPRDRLTDHNVLILQLLAPRDRLLGLKPGDSAQLDGVVLSNDSNLAAEKLRVEVAITGVQRAAIDVWAKTLSDAGVEFGFLVREDFTVGQAWQQWCQRFDWASDWQYKMIKQRFQWHRERFGEKCRWFYLDVFGDYTPQFVFDQLRNDFPDCFLFPEFPNDAAERTVQGWNWSGPMCDLERYVAPDGIVTVLPNRILTGDAKRDQEIMRKLWRNPHCFLVVHREAPALLKLAREAGLNVEAGATPPPRE